MHENRQVLHLHPKAHSQGWLQGPVTRAGAKDPRGKDPALGIRCSLVAVLRLSIICL